MKKTITFISILVYSITFSQYYPSLESKRRSADREIATLEKLDRLMQSDKMAEQQATEVVLSYNYGMKDYIRKYKSQLSSQEFNNIMDYQMMRWSMISQLIKVSGSYQNFLDRNYDMLLKYKNDVIERLHSALD